MCSQSRLNACADLAVRRLSMYVFSILRQSWKFNLLFMTALLYIALISGFARVCHKPMCGPHGCNSLARV